MGDRTKESRTMGLFQNLEEARREGLVPFTFGPMYVVAQIPFDTVKKFIGESSIETVVTYVDFPFPIITLPGAYSRRLFLMNKEAYGPYVEWITNQTFAHSDKQFIAQPIHMAAAVLDPYQRLIKATVPVPELVYIISVTTNKGMVHTETHKEEVEGRIFRQGEIKDLAPDEFYARLPKPVTAPPVIELKQTKPDPQMVRLANEFFE